MEAEIINIIKNSDLISQQSILNILGIPFTESFMVSLGITVILTAFLFLISKKSRELIAIIFYRGIEFIGGLALGNKSADHIAFVGATVSYLVIANTLSFFPIPFITFNEGLLIRAASAPTSDLNVTAALSIFSLIYITFNDLKRNGIKGYFKGYLEPLPFLLPLNIIGEIAKPFSLAMRLFGNIFSGGLIMNLVYNYIPVVLPTFFHLYFDIFAGLIQSLIFVSLTTVYLSFVVE